MIPSTPSPFTGIMRQCSNSICGVIPSPHGVPPPRPRRFLVTKREIRNKEPPRALAGASPLTYVTRPRQRQMCCGNRSRPRAGRSRWHSATTELSYHAVAVAGCVLTVGGFTNEVCNPGPLFGGSYTASRTCPVILGKCICMMQHCLRFLCLLGTRRATVR